MHIISHIWVLDTKFWRVLVQAHHPQGAQMARLQTNCQRQATIYMDLKYLTLVCD
jgi:hypothetical protein